MDPSVSTSLRACANSKGMRSYFSIFTIVAMSAALCGSGCNGNGEPTGTGGVGASTTTGAGTSSASSTTTGAGSSTTTGAGGAASTSAGAGGAGGDGAFVFACSAAPIGYAADVAPLFNGCSGGDGCHSLATGFHSPEASYAYLVGKASKQCMDGRLLVAPGDPEHSYVIDKLTNHNLCGGSGMPKSPGIGGSWKPRAAEDIQKIYDWICAGAKND